MAEFRLQVPDEFIQQLQDKLGGSKVTDIARDALTLFNWAVDEKARGRLVLSSLPDGDKVKQLAMTSLDQVPVRPNPDQTTP
jgi:hypothetical protein